MQPRRKLPPHNTAAAQPGPGNPKRAKVKAPRAGPKIKPKPKAMPIRPIFCVRFSGGVISAMYALATERFAPQIPAKTREASIIHNPECPVMVDATAKSPYETADPALLTRITGRRPMRSESRPQ